MHPYSVALTSCGRFDLLERTLMSLLPRLCGPLKEIVIGDDSGDECVRDVASQFDRGIVVLVNNPPIGQIKSIDRIYSQLTTEWVFHCEDDWEFFTNDFIEKSFAILESDEQLSMVALKDLTEYGRTAFGKERTTTTGIRYRVADISHGWDGRFGGIHFNPGLRRMAHYRKVGPYAAIGNKVEEITVSEAYRELGHRIALLAEPAVRHIGEGRHVRDPFKPSGLVHRLKRSATKRWRKAQDTFRASANEPKQPGKILKDESITNAK